VHAEQSVRTLRPRRPVEAAPPGPRRVPFSIANAALAALHSAYEVAGGVGLPGQKVLGLPGSVAAHAVMLGAWVDAATSAFGGRRRAAAVLNGLALAGAAAHYVAWPIRWRGPLPLLTDGAEGLRGGWARWYNGLLYLWGGAAAGALARERHRGDGPWIVAGIGAVPLVAVASHRKHDWVREQASRRRRWWNRALGPAT
jgi:hypothetical protein